jgi:hypothetical protein
VIKVIVAIRPNPATNDVAVVTVLAVVVVTVEIMFPPPLYSIIVHRDSFGSGIKPWVNLYLASLILFILYNRYLVIH